MSLYVKSGSTSTYLQSILNKNTDSYQKTMEQLSSGNKYTSVGDNPIDVCESAKLQVRIDSNTQATSNVNIGQDMLSMTEDSHATISSNIQRIRDLSVEAASGTYSSDDIGAILKEIKGRLENIDKMSSTTDFAGVGLLDGSSSSIFLQIGANTSSTMDVGDAFIDTHSTALGIGLDSTVTADTWTSEDAKAYLTNLDNATSTLSSADAKIGGYINRLDSVSQSLTKMNDNLTDNKSNISDTDTAAACADMVKYQILQEVSASILTQANQIPALALELLNN